MQERAWSRWATIAALACGLGACVPELPEGQYACESSLECPGGWSCVAGRCVSSSPTPGDAGAPLAGDDAGTVALADASAPIDRDGGAATDDDAGASLDASTTPVAPPQLAAGTSHACASTGEGALYCWGDNDRGQLGADPMRVPTSATALAVTGVPEVASLCAGADSTCVLGRGGEVVCWGAGSEGQLAGGPSGPSPSTVPLAGPASAITCGRAHVCALVDGHAWCWGASSMGQAGMLAAVVSSPSRVALDPPLVAIGAGAAFTCALDDTGGVWCWGAHAYGQLGTLALTPSATASSRVPLPVDGIADAHALAVGAEHACATSADETVRCWGRTDTGALGMTASAPQPSPRVVAVMAGLERLAAGAGHGCAFGTGGAPQCWGADRFGQLGDGTPADADPVPDPVAGIGAASSLAAGNGFTCALVTSGRGVEARCWGASDRGQLGDGSTLRSLVPARVIGLPEPL